MKIYSTLVLLYLITFILCNNQFTSGRKRKNLRALRHPISITYRTPLKTTKHTSRSRVTKV